MALSPKDLSLVVLSESRFVFSVKSGNCFHSDK